MYICLPLSSQRDRHHRRRAYALHTPRPTSALALVEARMSTPLKNTARGCLLRLHASPRASRTRLAGLHGDRVKLQIAAPPVDGKANKEIVAFLSKRLGVSKQSIVWVSGESGKRKSLEVIGLDRTKVAEKLSLQELLS